MHYLVTGGAGFIGSHLVRALINEGAKVRVLDNLSTGKREYLDRRAEFRHGDVRDRQAVRDALRGMTGVFHLAALPNVQYSIEHPLEAHEVNVDGSVNLILHAKEAGITRLVYSSSAAVYGDPLTLPITEDHPTLPKSPYGLHKLIGEQYMRLAASLWEMTTVSLRYFNVFGPNMASEGAYVNVISIFSRQFFSHQPLTIFGTGRQTRDFVYVDDVVRANIQAMRGPLPEPGMIINIGTGERRTVNEIADHFSGERQYLPARTEPRDSCADIRRASKLLAWKPETSLEVGLQKTIDWFRTQYRKSSRQ